MKKISTLIFIIISGCYIHAQVVVSPSIVGVNNANALKTLHIDGMGDNPTGIDPNAAQLINDVIIDEFGRLGLGNVPQYAVDIRASAPYTGIKIVDGNQNEEKVLTSDFNGFAAWQYAGTIPVTIGTLAPTGVSFPANTSTFINTGTYIDLDPGTWLIQVSMQTNFNTIALDERAWVRSTFTPASDIIGSAYISGLAINSRPSSISGYIIISNTSGAVKRYNYQVGKVDYAGTDAASVVITNLGGGNIPENKLYAIQLL